MSNILNLINSESIKASIRQGKRENNRAFDEFRKLEIKTGIFPCADGSAWVKLGDTEVVAGVKFSVGLPYPDSPDQGSFSLNLELSGISSPDFQTGPPQLNSLEFSRIADRAIRSSNAIDFKKLCIVPGEKVWVMFVDCLAINADGNLIDATEIAALCAIKNSKIPKLDAEHNIIAGEYTKERIELANIPLNFTFDKVGDSILLDPTEAEEFVSDARFSLGIVKDTVVSCQKSKAGVFSEKEIFTMIDIATKKYNEFYKKIEKQI